jgi:hypothetical protein
MFLFKRQYSQMQSLIPGHKLQECITVITIELHYMSQYPEIVILYASTEWAESVMHILQTTDVLRQFLPYINTNKFFSIKLAKCWKWLPSAITHVSRTTMGWNVNANIEAILSLVVWAHKCVISDLMRIRRGSVLCLFPLVFLSVD